MTNIISTVKSLNFPLGQYVVVASGIMEALGIRNSSDIDIAVTLELHTRLSETNDWKKEIKYNKVFLQKDKIEIIPSLDWDKFPIKTEEAIAKAMVIDGVAFMNLEMLKKFKFALGREKDFADIKLIDDYIADHK